MPKRDSSTEPHHDITDLINASNAKFQQDASYIGRLFGKTTDIKGCVINVVGREGKENYKKSFVTRWKKKRSSWSAVVA